MPFTRTGSYADEALDALDGSQLAGDESGFDLSEWTDSGMLGLFAGVVLLLVWYAMEG
jgi:hypothetical protein